MCARANALITIRQIQNSDKEPIRQLLMDTNMFTAEEVTVALELIDITLHDPHQIDYEIRAGIDEHQQVIGYYCIGPTALTNGTYDLYWIAVSPKAQNQGYGRQLLAHAEARIVNAGGRLIVAETSSQPKYEPTRLFYLNNRYSEVARIKNYYRKDDDLVIFGKYFSQ